jgi:hypothetical protein
MRSRLMSESSSSKGKTGGCGVGGDGGEGESEEITTTPYRSSILRLPEMGGRRLDRAADGESAVQRR